MTRPMLDSAARSVTKLGEKIEEYVLTLVAPSFDLLNPLRIKVKDAAKLQDEYAKLVEGLQETTDDEPDTDGFMANPRTLVQCCKVLVSDLSP